MALVLAERYVVGRAIVEGGQGRIVEGYDRSLSRRVAIKLLTAGTDNDAQIRFMREAYAGAGLVHPNIVSVYDAGEDGGIPYIVMELVEGENLQAHLARRGPLPARDVVRIARDVLSGLGAIHDRGLVHRDVKPGNILLPVDGPAKLADFGIVKRAAADPDLTQTGIVLGTPRYLAPEQAAGSPATPHSDVYAMGVTMYEMLAGAPPFDATDPLALALAHRADPVPPLDARRPGVPGYLVGIIEQALAKQPDGRFQDANAMLAALRGGSDMDPGEVLERNRTANMAVVPPRRPRVRRRKRRLALLAVALLVLAGAATAAAFVIADMWADEATTESTQPAASSAATTLPVQEAATSGTTVASTTTTAAPTTSTVPETVATTAPPLPSDLEGLVAAVAADPSAFGSASEELVVVLGDVLGIEGRRPRARAAENAIGDVRDWVDDGRLDPALGAAVIEGLEEIIAAAPGNNDDGGGDGGGNEGGDD